MPPDDAVICVVPTLTPAAMPPLLIVATLVVPLAQVKVTPDMVFPLLSLAVAVNCCVAFTAIDGEGGVTVIAVKVGGAGVGCAFEEEPQLVRSPQAAADKPRKMTKKAFRISEKPHATSMRVMLASLDLEFLL
jgi:hypothetical protein